MEIVSENKCFGGTVKFIKHSSSTVKTDMTFSVFEPKEASQKKLPVLYYLSGLTCTAENFTFKAGAFKKAAELGMIIVCPDTSPRGAGVDGEDERYDLGAGAGFYIDSTTAKWSENYQMYSYVTKELPQLIEDSFNIDSSKVSITGHSMGGHGALICALKNPSLYKSVSAFSPIVNPVDCPWGQLAFSEYLGEDQESWKAYDACELVRAHGWQGEILIEQGKADQFLEEQLKPQNFVSACEASGVKLSLNMREGYDHSYYFISTFIDDHLDFHFKELEK
ncbi:MAG: S-formylglutathione hydrolase [Lentisphaeraceae bacterium]|nr:S-formylglutathione hydrolase [Lentisphaeraceae bacterium]